MSQHADLDKAVDYIVTARINNAGQVCTCPERIFVHEDVHDDFINKVKIKWMRFKLEHPYDENTDYGAIINQNN